MDTRFHCVYLLTSLDPQCEGDFYIGYTVNPLRRLRQHNGELVNGARRTSRRGRPWTIVCCVSGFTEDRVALKFEWCWQNPTVSARLKHTVGILKGLRRLPYAVGTLHLLIRAPLFNQLDLTLHIFEPDLLHGARAKVEVFLAMRGGAKPMQGMPSSPQNRATTEGEAAGAAAPISTQVLNVSSAYGSASAPPSSLPLLPPLEPSSLFHVEVLTRHAFEDAYLSHDRCLLLPSVGALTGGGDSCSYATDRENEDSCLSASCPYDVSVLSQAARAEWTNAPCEPDSAVASDIDGDDGAAQFVLANSLARSRMPSPDYARVRGGTPEMLLGYRSEERAGGACEEKVDVLDSTSASRSNSRPPSLSRSPSLAQTTGGGGGVGCSAVAGPSHPGAPSSPASFDASTDASAGRCPRIPLRFAHYSEADFASAHADEQYRLHHGYLPCSLCALPLRPPCVVHCTRAPFCELRCHLSCLAMWMLYAEEANSSKGSAVRIAGAVAAHELPQQTQQPTPSSPAAATTALSAPAPFRRLIPAQPSPCPLCGVSLQWGVLVKELKKRVVLEGRLQAAQRRKRIEQRWQTRLAQINGNRMADRETKRGIQPKKRLRMELCESCSSAGKTPTSCASPLSQVKVFDTPLQTPLPDASTPPLLSSLTPSSMTPQPTSSPQNTDKGLSSSTTLAAPADSSLLSWTAFSEDDWLL
ncbi:hypothetical protein ABB37_05401 [Leptomonas pyrrhocoris]|uniref:Structure-specific endonuclease subunit SLX1 homolog n=1 Tax=Leptomonas pyrrhocoris TaxID=157538 RepID=A0A0M9FZZ7_LEPPY|nr:hypothetical protein ABB37_05401 [Leptomonas pyrrhocoris]KPA79600.1 hypothetical protein ABB37_05401 [Leptomonas pyrrhocoris]|eukprot:XP_015658039.1 hypothetical protein ABB37_05401 [Leptomonas pyrrhocoris]